MGNDMRGYCDRPGHNGGPHPECCYKAEIADLRDRLAAAERRLRSVFGKPGCSDCETMTHCVTHEKVEGLYPWEGAEKVKALLDEDGAESERRREAAEHAPRAAESTSDAELSCIACGEPGCEREVTLLIESKAGARKRVWVGLHDRCGIVGGPKRKKVKS